MSIDPVATAKSLREEAARLKEQAARLIGAANLLDPKSGIEERLMHPLEQPDQARLPNLRSAMARVRIRNFSTARIAEKILREYGGPISRDILFEKTKNQGSPVTDISNFASVLSRAENLMPLGNGLWDLRERHPEKGGME